MIKIPRPELAKIAGFSENCPGFAIFLKKIGLTTNIHASFWALLPQNLVHHYGLCAAFSRICCLPRSVLDRCEVFQVGIASHLRHFLLNHA